MKPGSSTTENPSNVMTEPAAKSCGPPGDFASRSLWAMNGATKPGPVRAAAP
jgi:hypothetical protein